MAIEINMENVREIVRESVENELGAHSRHGTHLQVNVDTETGEVWSDWEVGESWHKYHNPHIQTVCHLYGPITEDDLFERVLEAIEANER